MPLFISLVSLTLGLGMKDNPFDSILFSAHDRLCAERLTILLDSSFFVLSFFL